MPPRRKKISFNATRVVKKPTTVRFKTKSGQRVSFNATKLIRKSSKVTFYAKKKRK